MNKPAASSSGSTDALTVEARIAASWAALQEVKDPEIPVVSVLELGMIADVRAAESGLEVDLMPTFAACPAIAVLRSEIREALLRTGVQAVVVNVVFDPPWTTDRITPAGREKLKAFGLAPPGSRCDGPTTPRIEPVACPYCDATDTVLESLFGPTLCRAIHYCRTCRQSFERFKVV